MARRKPNVYYKKGKYLRRKKYKRKKNKIIRSLTPRTKLVKLRYADTIAMNPGASGALNRYQFRANGMYDPDITSGGHQPLGFDQYMSMYNHFTVISSKITVTIPSTEGTYPSTFTLYLSDDATTAFTSQGEIIEQPGTVYKVTSGKHINPIVLSKTFNAKKDLGVSKPLSETAIRGNASADPTEIGVFNLFMQSLDPTIDLAIIYAIVTIDYVAVLTEPKELGQS